MYMMQALIRAALNYEMEHYLWFPEMYREELHHEDLV